MARYQYFPDRRYNLYKELDEMPKEPEPRSRLIDTQETDIGKQNMIWTGTYWQYAYLYYQDNQTL